MFQDLRVSIIQQNYHLCSFHLSITIYCPLVFNPIQRTSEWLSSTEDHNSQEISIEKLTDEILPGWFTRIHLTDTNPDMKDDTAHIAMEIDHAFSSGCTSPSAVEYTIIEKPRPNVDRLLKKPTIWKKRNKDEWPSIIPPSWDYTPKPTRQSTPKKSTPSPNTSPIVACHRELRPKRINFEI